MKICKIDGKKVNDLDKLIDQVGKQVAPGEQFDHNMDSFNDLLKGGKITKDGEAVDIVWENAEDSQRSLGEDKFQLILEMIRDHGPEGQQAKDNVHLYLT
jgi:RNAse (barnase) inhibitor barstar